MSDFTAIKCKNCGAELAHSHASDGIAECEYCHGLTPVPKSGDERAVSFLQMAEHELDIGRFDDAYAAFNKAADCDRSEPQAYFGMALAEFKVRYLKDEVNNRLQPICHEITERAFTNNRNYRKALELASSVQRAEYERMGNELDYIGKKFFEFKRSGLDYDCFICVKVTDGERKTTDSDRANDLYYYLRDKGYVPFYSEREIQNKTGADYEAHILYALYSSECMIIVCGNEEYLQTPWVKNEYTRFIGLIDDERKTDDSVAIAWFDTPIERLPGKPGRLQGVCINKPDAFSKLYDFVNAHYQSGLIAPKIKRKVYGGATREKKAAISSRLEKRALASIARTEVTVSEQSKLDIVKTMMTSGNFRAAISRCQAITELNPSRTEAYWYMFLAENGCSDDIAFINSHTKIKSFVNLESAIATGGIEQTRAYYDVLYRRALSDKKLYIYREYIELPESTDAQIDELNRVMFEHIMCDDVAFDEARSIFDEMIKTVTVTDLYIDMNVKFADKACEVYKRSDAAIKYYKNVIDADAANRRAMWQIFILENKLKKSSAVAKLLANKDKHADIESTLFSYGFNGSAIRELFKACYDNFNKLNDEALTTAFDFLLTLIPDERNDIYLKDLKAIVNRLLIAERYTLANKYNDQIVATDKLDHRAYFNRIYIKRKTLNPFKLASACDELFNDKDFSLAIDTYVEAHPALENVYINFVNRLKDWNACPIKGGARRYIVLCYKLSEFGLEVEDVSAPLRVVIDSVCLNMVGTRKRKDIDTATVDAALLRCSYFTHTKHFDDTNDKRKTNRASDAPETSAGRKKGSWLLLLFMLPTVFVIVMAVVSFVHPAFLFGYLGYGWIIAIGIATPFIHGGVASIWYCAVEKNRGRMYFAIACDALALIMAVVFSMSFTFGRTVVISNYRELQMIDDFPYYYDITYILEGDIDCGGKELPKIETLPANAKIYGNGYSIKNFKVTKVREADDFVSDHMLDDKWYTVAMIGTVYGEVRDLILSDCVFDVEYKYERKEGKKYATLALGGIAGIVCGGTLDNCIVKDCEFDISRIEGFDRYEYGSKQGKYLVCGWICSDDDGEINGCQYLG